MPANIEAIDFHGLPALRLSTASGARAVVTLYGAQVVSWIPAGGEERLYLSERAVFDAREPIRGGVPVCFPQFSELGPLPKHGFVRTRDWKPVVQRTGEDFALVTLRFDADNDTRALWPHEFGLELTIAIEDSRLDLEFDVSNRGSEAFSFTAALHSYLRVREVEESRLEGLYGLEYRDQVKGNRITRDSGDIVLIEDETDRIYHDLKGPVLLREYDRSLGINAEGFPDAVVWNPWEARCAALADMPDAGFRRMLCVEAALIRQPKTLAPGEDWWGRQTLIAL